MASYFTEDFHRFFIDLAPNNNREWFEKNKSRYEKSVKEPFYNFTTEFIEKVKKEDPSIDTTATKAVFRIYRDIRFSKDKTPYKMYMAASVSPLGKKHVNGAGFYFEFGPENLQFYQGAYFIEPPALLQLRTYMLKKKKKLEELLKDKSFRKYYGEVLGDGQTRIPKEFKEAAAQLPLFGYKNIYWHAKESPDKLLDKNLMQIVFNHYKAGKPLCDFLNEGFR
jgi:uncharacterized protein (TIGR02453 family)